MNYDHYQQIYSKMTDYTKLLKVRVHSCVIKFVDFLAKLHRFEASCQHFQ